MKPILILPRGQMSQAAIKMLRENGLCVVEAKDPSQVRFVETPSMDYTAQEQAAIKLVKKLLSERMHTVPRSDIDAFLVGELTESLTKPVKPLVATK